MDYNENIYTGFDPFEGDRDVGIRNKTVKIVKTRKDHDCIGEDSHVIKPGALARFESAIVDEKWASYYMCIPCMDKWLKQIGY